MNECENCGRFIEDNAKYCEFCAYLLDAAESIDAAESNFDFYADVTTSHEGEFEDE